jgi:hypothetical protein
MQKSDGVVSPPTYAEIGTAVRLLDGEQVTHVRDLSQPPAKNLKGSPAD